MRHMYCTVSLAVLKILSKTKRETCHDEQITLWRSGQDIEFFLGRQRSHIPEKRKVKGKFKL